MGKIIPIETNQRHVRAWLDIVSKTEALINVAIAVDAKGDEVARQVAEEIRNQEMLTLRHQGFEMPEGFSFKPEVTEQEIDGKTFLVTMYRFVESDWKREIMGRDK